MPRPAQLRAELDRLSLVALPRSALGEARFGPTAALPTQSAA